VRLSHKFGTLLHHNRANRSLSGDNSKHNPRGLDDRSCVEAHLWGNWLLRAEYRYADFGAWSTSFAFPSPAPGVGNNTYRLSNSVNTNIATAGLAYKF
jgi:hypothetical protein